jgi:hypothetical protein
MLAAGPSLVSFGYVRGPIRLEHEFLNERVNPQTPPN